MRLPDNGCPHSTDATGTITLKGIDAENTAAPETEKVKGMQVIEWIRQNHARLTAIRRDIHAHPELAFAEHRTAELVARHLQSLGIEFYTGIGQTGVVAVV